MSEMEELYNWLVDEADVYDFSVIDFFDKLPLKNSSKKIKK